MGVGAGAGLMAPPRPVGSEVKAWHRVPLKNHLLLGVCAIGPLNPL